MKTEFYYDSKLSKTFTQNYGWCHLFSILPSFEYSFGESISSTNSSTNNAASTLNSSSSNKSAKFSGYTGSAIILLGIKELGKKGRSINSNSNITIIGQDRLSTELSELTGGGVSNIHNLLFDSKGMNSVITSRLNYVEPLAKKWALSTEISGTYIHNTADKVAYDYGTTNVNDYFSAKSETKHFDAKGGLLLQYSSGRDQIHFGAIVQMTLNEIFSKSLGISTTTGKGEWFLDWSPYIHTSFMINDNNLRFSYQGLSNRPSRSKIIPIPDVSNPTSITFGNIYLKPTFQQDGNIMFSRNNKKLFSFLYGGINFSLKMRSIVSAIWFDDSGIRYSIPINSKNPGINSSLYVNYELPMGKKKLFKLRFSLLPRFMSDISYQSLGTTPGIDIDHFDYYSFMSTFWGDENGDIFYSGRSGFLPSKFRQYEIGGSCFLEFKSNNLLMNVGYEPTLSYSTYSLDSKANNFTRIHGFRTGFEYVTPSQWEFKTSFNYSFYRGYTYGFDKPTYRWNLSINKNIKAFTLMLSAYDILNSTPSSGHIATDNYVEDNYNLRMGRYILVGIKFNFGKMNQKNARAAQRDAMLISM